MYHPVRLQRSNVVSTLQNQWTSERSTSWKTSNISDLYKMIQVTVQSDTLSCQHFIQQCCMKDHDISLSILVISLENKLSHNCTSTRPGLWPSLSTPVAILILPDSLYMCLGDRLLLHVGSATLSSFSSNLFV